MLDPNYIVGFVDGEGCFSITVNRHKGRKLPEFRLLFEIEVREDDEEIIRQIQEVLDCGKIYRLDYARYKKWRAHVKYKVSDFTSIKNKIIPFFQKYPLQAKKRFQFQRFCLVAEMMDKKLHLSPEGVNRIIEIRHKDSLDALDTHVQWGIADTNCYNHRPSSQESR